MRCPSCQELLDLSTAKFCPACGTPVGTELRVDPLVGQLVGSRYRVTHLMAEGGMGRVYAAEQAMGDSVRKVAIKVLLAEYSGRDQDMQRLTRECSTVAELEHPNTIKFFDYGETEQGDLFIAMEFLAGLSLAQVLKNGALPPERVDLLVGQICGSLQEAHSHGIVHRDLKPDNIILTSPGGAPDFVKVLDFGIAKRVGGRDPKLTPLGVVLGSPPYMSPEQFTMQDVDHRSDIYSMGVVTYQMLTGKLPFSANDPLEWAALHMGVPPTPVDAHGVPIPPQMRSAIHRALAKEPQNRPASMREFYGEFTIGAGTFEPSRFSSIMPLVPSQFPLPPRPISSFPTAAAVEAATPPAIALDGPPATTRDSEDLPALRESIDEGTVDLDPASDPTRVRRPSVEEPPPASEITNLIDPRSPPASDRVVSRGGDTSLLDQDDLLPPAPSQPAASNEAPTIRDFMSGPEISFHELNSSSELSLPPAEISPVTSSKGTLVMAASEPPPPKSALAMPDLLPPTIRDPLVQVQSATRRTLVWIALALVGLGAIASAVGWLVFVRPAPSKPKKSKSSGSALVVNTAAPQPGTNAPQGAPAPVQPRVSGQPVPAPAPTQEDVKQPEKLSPCQTAIFSAVSGKCDLARRAHARCAEDSPYRASADRALTGLCR